MKKAYLKPDAEYVNFSFEDRLMTEEDEWGDMGGEMGTSDLPEGWE